MEPDTRTEDATTGLLDWLTGGSKKPRHPAAAPREDLDDAALLLFTCTTCGRTDLPEAGDWDPPICLECDAAINFDAILEEEWHEEQEDR
jgi:hypothetical protein